jgi:G3E family GTPase
MSQQPDRIPVTVLTGFLGSGKTTLLNRILTEQHGLRIAVIENEYGEIGIDHDLVVQTDEEIFEMNNGCICCTVRGDLIRILGRLAERRDKFDQVLIETTGLADPGPVAQTFFAEDDISARYRLDGIVTLVDAKHVLLHLDESDECHEQIAFADVVLLNKTDLATEDELSLLERRIRNINAMAQIHRTQNSTIDMHAVLGIGGFDLKRALEVKPTFLEPEYPFEYGAIYELAAGTYTLHLTEAGEDHLPLLVFGVAGADAETLKAAVEVAVPVFSADGEACELDHVHDEHCGHDHGHSHDHAHDHDHGAHAHDHDHGDHDHAHEHDHGHVHDEHCHHAHGDAVHAGEVLTPELRARELHLHGAGPWSVQLKITEFGNYAIFMAHDPSEFNAQLQNSEGEVVKSAIEREFDGGHSHDEEVGSVGFTFRGDLDADKVSAFLSQLTQEDGGDLFRYKGILSIAGENQRFVFQGVHMLFDGTFDRPWGQSPRQNAVVFIGRNLDRDKLETGFGECLV